MQKRRMVNRTGLINWCHVRLQCLINEWESEKFVKMRTPKACELYERLPNTPKHPATT